MQVILEHEKDVQKFRKGLNYDEQKESAIAARFRKLIRRHGSPRFDVAGLFVVFSAFAPIAKIEADDRLSAQDLEALKNRIPDLWEISRFFGHVTFMFYTDEQAKSYEAMGKKDVYARMYCNMLKPYDEFGYLVEEEFTVAFDSKQNLDKNYNGNWWKYYR